MVIEDKVRDWLMEHSAVEAVNVAAGKAAQIRSLVEDSGYTRAEAKRIVDAGGLE